MDKDAGSCVIGHKRFIVTSAVPDGTRRSTHPYPARIPQRAQSAPRKCTGLFSVRPCRDLTGLARAEFTQIAPLLIVNY
jgi:hypothetical protein